MTVNNSSGGYTISGTGSIAGTGSLTKTGSRTLTLNTVNTYTGWNDGQRGYADRRGCGSFARGAVSLSGTGILRLGPNTGITYLTSLSITGSAKFDVNNDEVIISYGATDPISTIAGYLASGYTGHWTGSGIDSLAAQNNSTSYGLGYADAADPGNPAGLPAGEIEVMYTLLGDANLDGKVNGTDFNLMAANFNQAVTNGWDEGDFNYDGKVNGSDFVLLANNFNQFASQSAYFIGRSGGGGCVRCG